jgi:hypothetical protein
MDRKNQKIALREAIVEFEQTAKKLVQLLSDSFDFDLSTPYPFGKLIDRQTNLWKGKGDENWDYQFHGDACMFTNSVTIQLVDVKINRNGNWGTISNFYLFKFIETTASLKHIFNLIDSEKKVNELLDELLKDEILIDIGEPHFRTLVLNKADTSKS